MKSSPPAVALVLSRSELSPSNDRPAFTRLSRWVPASVRVHPKWARIEHWVLKLGEFFLAQGLLQVVSAIGGFLLLRWMSVESYATFTLTFAIQSAMIACVDVGFSGAIVPLVGARTNDRSVIGAYVAAARRLRRWMLPFVLGGGLAVFWFLGRRQNVDVPTIAGLFVLVAVTLWFNAISVLYGGPIVIRQDLRYLQGVQNVMGLLRVAGYAGAHAAGWLGSVTALGLNAALNGGLAAAMRHRGRPAIDEPAGDAPAAEVARKEILRFVRPQVPVLAFNAVQGQITIFLVSFVGNGASLAAIGALSRLNLLFSVTPYFLGWIVQPYFSRLGPAMVSRRFWQLTLAGMAALAMAPLFGFLLPAPFLWLLGPNYGHLRIEVGLLLLAGAIGASVGLVSTLSLSRRWIFADAILWIAPLTVGFQAVVVAWGDVSSPSGAIGVMIAGNTGSLIAYLMLAVRGQRRTVLSSP